MFEVPIEQHLSYADAQNFNWEAKLHKHYGSRKCDAIFLVYLLSIILWTLIVIYLSPKVPLLGYLILFVPYLVFFVSIMSLSNLSRYVEEEMFDSVFITTILLISVPLIGFLIQEMKSEYARELSKFLIIGSVLMMFSMVDFWVSEKWLSVTVHIRSIMQTLALTLIVFSLYAYYVYKYEYSVSDVVKKID